MRHDMPYELLSGTSTRYSAGRIVCIRSCVRSMVSNIYQPLQEEASIPAPIIGESPTLPHLLFVMPPVEVAAIRCYGVSCLWFEESGGWRDGEWEGRTS